MNPMSGSRAISQRLCQTAQIHHAGRAGRIAGLAALTAVLLASCTMKPEPITQQEHVQRAKDDYQTLYAAYKPLEGPLTLSDAIARALKYNYDSELSKVELSLQDKQFDLALTQMLPRLAASAGYNWRNNDNAAESVSELTKKQSLEYSFSEEPTHGTAGLELSWNIVDFGVSYYQAKQQGYRTFVAVERRRKVINGIVKGVQDAYWKAEAANRLLPRVIPLLAEAQHMLDASRESTSKKLEPALQSLDFQQGLLQVIGQLKHIQSDLITARLQLASLVNVPADGLIQFPAMDMSVHGMAGPIDPRNLETIGLAMRPELREEAYQEKIDKQDVYKEIIKMMPGVGILGSINYDSNRYLFNPSWGQLGIQASYNLVNLIEGPKAIEAARTAVGVAKARRLALSVAVLTQVNLSYQEYQIALDDYGTTKQIDDVQQQIGVASRNISAANAQSEADRVRRELAAMVSELSYDRSVSQVHTALVNLYASVGVDLVPASVQTDDLAALSQQINRAISGWEAGEMPQMEVALQAPAAPPQPVAAAAPQPMAVASTGTGTAAH
jgi:outer membrane protein TolC